ncbi:MAG: phage portal protein [Pseudorhodobacter sp.]|nr:phage portal protein [Pseudorhodobacter sp.]
MGFRDLFRRRTDPPPQVRRFDGAADGRRGFGMGTFGRTGTETMLAGATLRSRARYAAANNAWLANGVGNLTGALVGPGIEPTGDPEAVAVYNLWADVADADGRTDFRGLQAEIARGLVVDGEAFLQVIDTAEGPRLRLIPPELIDESRIRDIGDGRFIVSGVEFNADGSRAAYHVMPARPTDVFATTRTPVRLPAEEILHIFKPLGAGQVRGASWLAPIILPANELDQLQDALAVGAKVAAMLCGFVVNQNATGGEDPFDGADQPSLEPGTLQRLAGGWDVKFTTPAQVSQVDPLLKLGLRQLAAGLGMPEYMLSGDLSDANYSSLRAGLLPFRQRIEQAQYHVFVPQMLNPIWRLVIRWAAAAGELPEFESDPRRFLKVEWLPPRPLQVDPLKDTQATVAELEAGLTSRKKAVAERGWALADLDAEIAADAFQRPATSPAIGETALEQKGIEK